VSVFSQKRILRFSPSDRSMSQRGGYARSDASSARQTADDPRPSSQSYYQHLHQRQLASTARNMQPIVDTRSDAASTINIGQLSAAREVYNTSTRVYGGAAPRAPAQRIKGAEAAAIAEKGMYSDGLWRSLPNERISPTNGKIVSTSKRCFEAGGPSVSPSKRDGLRASKANFGMSPGSVSQAESRPEPPAPNLDQLRHSATPHDTMASAMDSKPPPEQRRQKASVAHNPGHPECLKWDTETPASAAPPTRKDRLQPAQKANEKSRTYHCAVRNGGMAAGQERSALASMSTMSTGSGARGSPRWK